MRRSLLLLIASAALIAAQENGRSSKQFWMGFERGISQARAEVQKTLEDNLMTAMDRVASLGHKIGSFSHQDEDEEVLPTEGRPLSPEDAPIEAIGGKLGYDGLDDGLQVYFKGDSDREELPEPHIIPSDKNSFAEAPGQDTRVVIPPRTGGPLFDLKFGFPFRVPFVFTSGGGTRIFQRNQWWQGENVCVEESEEEETPEQLQEEVRDFIKEEDGDDTPLRGGKALFYGHLTLHTCSEQRDRYTCTTKVRKHQMNRSTTKIYRCCHGFTKEENGCVKVDILPLPESLELLGLKSFLFLASNSKTIENFERENMTLFVPSDEALLDFISANQKESNDIHGLDNGPRRITNLDEGHALKMRDTLDMHAHEGIMYSGDFQDEEVISSLSSLSSLRVNVYPQAQPSLITVNCVPIVKTDKHYGKGVIHVVDRVIEPASKTIAQILESDPELSSLKQLMLVGGMMDKLKSPGQYTLLAPSNEAFDKDMYTYTEAFLNSTRCTPAIARNHILPNTICAGAMTSTAQARTMNLLDKFLTVKYVKSGNIYFDDALVMRKDIVASNGVIHVIDKILLPDEGLSASYALERLNFTDFMYLVKEARMMNEIDQDNITIFAPDNEAVNRLLAFNESDEFNLENRIGLHISKQPFDPENSFNNHILETVRGGGIRINYFRGPPVLSFTDMIRGPSAMMRVTAACVPIPKQEIQVCGGTRIRFMNEALDSQEFKVIEVLLADENLSIFQMLVLKSNLMRTLNKPGPLTIFAPTNHVFRTLPTAELDELMLDRDIADELVMRHIVKGFICCSGITPSSLFDLDSAIPTLHGNSLMIHRTSNGRLMAGSARIIHCGTPLQNGLVHYVDKLFIEPHVPEPNFNWDHRSPSVMRVPLYNN